MYSGYQHYGRAASSKVDAVNSPNQAWTNQEPHWMLVEDLAQGTYQMRRRHRRYLPQELREIDESYDARLSRSVCPPYFQRLERMLAGMLTRKPIRLENISDAVREQMFDVDLEGNNLDVWTYNAARLMVRYGHIGVLVDAPAAGQEGRPYWKLVTPREILGFRAELRDGKQELTQLRLSERVILPDGEYGEKEVQQVRVLRPGEYAIHRANDEGEFVVVEEGRTTMPHIPFSVAYANRVAFMESRPPLMDIAELNLKAYQAESDIANQLHLSSVPFLAIFGFPAAGDEITVGPQEALNLPSEGDARYISPPSDAFDAQFTNLDRIASQINTLGLSAVLGQKLSAETAESKRIDRSQGDSTMMVIAQNMQDLIDNCLMHHGHYLGLNDTPSSYVNRDFLGTRLEPQEIQALLQLYTAGTITQSTLLLQLSEGEVLGDDFDVEEEIEATQLGGLDGEREPEPVEEPEEDDEVAEEEEPEEDEEE